MARCCCCVCLEKRIREICEEVCGGGCDCKFIGLQMQTQNSQNSTVNSHIPFDTLILDVSDGSIVYNADNSSFNLSGPAIYKIDWQVAYSNADNIACFGVMYENSTLISMCNSQSPSEASGSALLDAYQENGAMSLVVSGSTVNLSDVPVQANIVITRI